MGTLYDQDFVLWSKEQARALRDAARAGWNAPIDWTNVAEEIESLGKSDRRALTSHVGVVLEHLLKLQASPAEGPRKSWGDTVIRARGEIEKLLVDSPSLRREIGAMVSEELPRARRLARRGLETHGEAPVEDVDQITLTEEQILGDWLPEEE